jgi:hypothetical protein
MDAEAFRRFHEGMAEAYADAAKLLTYHHADPNLIIAMEVRATAATHMAQRRKVTVPQLRILRREA